MSDRPSFRQRPAAPTGPGRERGMLALALLVGTLLLTRTWWMPAVPEGALVEVVGDVPRPGMRSLPEPVRLADAVRAAGGPGEGLPDTILHPGDRVVVGPDGAHVEPAGDPLLVGLPIDLNRSDALGLEALPGVGAKGAEAIVADRASRGLFYSVDDLGRVSGFGRAAVDRVRPYVTVGDVPERPAPTLPDLNRASAAELERLPGIGPVTAARIVVDREDHGPFADLDALTRVPGIGPATVRGLRGRVQVEAP